MSKYPLVRTHWSNEHIMAGVFAVLLLYLLPGWITDPADTLSFAAVLAVALTIDCTAGFIRYRRLVCGVSAAVTAGILQVLTPGVPLWGRLIGITASLILGKHIWGGTGKNIINPAITGLILIELIFNVSYPVITPSLLLLPALLLSLPFAYFRPAAAAGMIAGLSMAMITGDLAGIWAVAANAIFFGCIVVTDPVTVTPRFWPGLAGGLLAGVIPAVTGQGTLSLAMALAAFNLASYFMDETFILPVSGHYSPKLRIRGYKGDVVFKKDSGFLEEDSGREGEVIGQELPSREAILEAIAKSGLYGLGGAAFPVYEKLKAVIASEAKDKYLIVNGVECDPGLVHDKWLMQKHPREIAAGLAILFKCIDFTEVIIAVKKGCLNLPGEFRLLVAEDLYPAGAEKILAEKALGKRIPAGSIPAMEGILILNVQTIYSLFEVLWGKWKQDSKFITAADLKTGKCTAVRVSLGDRVHDVMERIYPGNKLVFTGGGMMQAEMADENAVIEKTTNYIAAAKLPEFKESPFCSRCGLCRKGCPASLEVNRIADLADKGKLKETAPYHPEYCLCCGGCSYVCLAGRNLSARTRAARDFIKAQNF